MIDLMKLPASEAERLAYAEGFTGTAELFARLATLEHAAQTLLTALDLYGGDKLGDEIDTAIGDLRMVLP